ncbi:MAG: hypothetical protein V4638_11780 [Bacteroidota bacterium]
MKQENKLTKKIQVVLNDLKLGDEDKMSKAILAIQSVGKAQIIPDLVQLLHEDLSAKNRKELIDVFNNLSDSDAIEYMMEEVNDDKNESLRSVLLNTMWNSKLDYSAFLPDFVLLAIQGDFTIALECLTIIENLDGPFSEQLILECQLLLREYMEDKSPKDAQKATIMSEIALFVRDVEEDDEDGFFDVETLD